MVVNAMGSRLRFLFFVGAIALLFLPLFVAPSVRAAEPPPAPDVVADGVAILDENGNMVYGKNPHKHLRPASMTKTMTALVVLDHLDIHQKTVIDVSWDEVPDSSIMGLAPMDEMTIEDLLYGLMLPSGNDAARALARAVSGDEYRFVKLMNQKAQQLGLVDTHFMNPHGRDQDGHYTSAYDLARLGYFVMHNPILAKIVNTRQKTVYAKGIYPMRNINRVLTTYEGADGVKTGYDDLALAGVIATAVRDGRRVYVTLMHTGDYATEAGEMMDYYFANYSTLVPLPSVGAGN